MKTTKISVRVRFIGKIWMPACVCASSFTLGECDNLRFSEPWNLGDNDECLEFVEHLLWGEKSGDFQSIIDFEAIREITVTEEINSGLNRVVDSKSSFVTIHPWGSEENEMTWHDATYGAEVEA